MEIGFVGAFFILAAWIYETLKTYKKKEKVDIKFVAFYVVGLALLTVYSFQIGDLPFMVLNATILTLTLIELDLVLRQRKKREKR